MVKYIFLIFKVAPYNVEEASSEISEDISETSGDDISEPTTTRSYPLWVRQWQELKDVDDPVIHKSAEDLADMSALAARLRRLRRKKLGCCTSLVRPGIEAGG